MKFFNKITVTSGLEIIFIIIFLLIPTLSDWSWWWFFTPLVFFIIADTIIGIIVVAVKWSKKKKPEVMKINIKDAKKRAIYEMKYDDDNPDNFQILQEKTIHRGKDPKTPILLLEGRGTELNQKRVVIINMNNPKQKITKLTDPLVEDIEKYANLIADNPEEEKTKETTTTALDTFGRPTTTTTTTKPTSLEETKKKEEEEAEKGNAM